MEMTFRPELRSMLITSIQSIKASDRSIKAWSNHVDGAAALVCARGTEQFSNAQSVSLFRAVRTVMVGRTNIALVCDL